MDTFVKVRSAYPAFTKLKAGGLFERDMKLLKNVIVGKVQAQLAMKSYERDPAVIIQVDKPQVLDLPAFQDLIEEMAQYNVVVEREVGFPPMTPEYFVRLVFPVAPTHTVLAIQDFLEREMEGYSRRRYAL